MRGLTLTLITGLVAGLLAGLWSTELPAAEPHRLAYSKKLGLEVLAADPGDGWCRETLVLDIFAEDETLFSRDPFKVLVQKIGKVVERECPAAKGAEINGYRAGGNEPIFGGTALLSDKWALAVPPPETETAVDLDAQPPVGGGETRAPAREGQITSRPSQDGVSEPTAKSPVTHRTVLDEYPRLSQLDKSIYHGTSLFEREECASSGTDCEKKYPVPKLACLATVYTMIERGRGNAEAPVDDFYRLDIGGDPSKLSDIRIGAEVPIDMTRIKAALNNGLPVVLHGTGGPLGQHYILVVGWEQTAEGEEVLIANDPWPGKNSTRPGKQISISTKSLQHPELAFSFDAMRLLRAVPSTASVASTEPAAPSETAASSPSDSDEADETDDHAARHAKASFHLYPLAPPYVFGTRDTTSEMLENLQKEAAAGNTMAQYALGLAHRGEYKDPAKAREWLERAATGGLEMAYHPLALLYSSGTLPGGPDYAKAFEWWSKAEQTEPSRVYGLRHIGWMYKEGLHVRQDFDEAERRLKRAADQFDDPWAQMELALLYVDRRFPRRDDRKALKLFKALAESKYSPAYRHLGIMYQNGEGTAVDMAEAFKWFTAAHKAGDRAGTTGLAWRYWRGEGTRKDPAKAAALFEQAGNAGGVKAQAQMGLVYYSGRGRPKDTGKAVEWFEKAANVGHVGAMRNLGVIYMRGEGVAKDAARAKGHLERAANKGDATSQYLLGLFYAGGYEGKPDMNEARNWYEKAAAQGYEPAKQNLEKLAEATRPKREDGEENSGQVVGLDAVQSEDSVPEGHSKDYVFKNFICGKIVNNSYGSVRVYVDDNINLANLNMAKQLLDISGKYIKENCPSINGYRNISVSIFKKSDINKEPISVKNISARNTNLDKLDWKHYYSNEFYKEHLINKKRQTILDFLESHNVTNFVDPDSLHKNPFIYEGSIVAFEGKFERMLTRNEAVVAGVFLSNVPTEVFKTGGRFLIAGRVIGNKAVKSPFGGEIMLPHVEFADAFKGKYEYQDIYWVESQFAN